MDSNRQPTPRISLTAYDWNFTDEVALFHLLTEIVLIKKKDKWVDIADTTFIFGCTWFSTICFNTSLRQLFPWTREFYRKLQKCLIVWNIANINCLFNFEKISASYVNLRMNSSSIRCSIYWVFLPSKL